MSISENIRTLADEGVSVAEIAKRLGIRYQHAYNVLKRRKTLTSTQKRVDSTSVPKQSNPKPALSVEELTSSGFAFASRWILSQNGAIILERPLPNDIGVYAFAKDGIVLYVGVATMGLAKRLYFYGKPGVTQRTSQRLNDIIKNELLITSGIDIYIAIPPNLEWNGLPVHGSAGLELGLIKKYALPWNMRSTK